MGQFGRQWFTLCFVIFVADSGVFEHSLYLSFQSNPFDPKASPEQSSAKPASPDAANIEPMDVERAATPIPLEEVSEPMKISKSYSSV